MSNNRLTIIRWFARILDGIVLTLIMTFIIGEQLPDFLNLTVAEKILTVAVAAMILGEIIAWVWEGFGSLFIICGLIGFVSTNSYATRHLWPGWTFSLFALSGVLFFTTWLLSKRPVPQR